MNQDINHSKEYIKEPIQLKEEKLLIDLRRTQILYLSFIFLISILEFSTLISLLPQENIFEAFIALLHSPHLIEFIFTVLILLIGCTLVWHLIFSLNYKEYKIRLKEIRKSIYLSILEESIFNPMNIDTCETRS